MVRSTATPPSLSVEDAAALAAGLEVRRVVAERPEGWVAECARTALAAEHGFVRREARIGLQVALAEEAIGALVPVWLPRLRPEAVVAGISGTLAWASVRAGSSRIVCRRRPLLWWWRCLGDRVQVLR